MPARGKENSPVPNSGTTPCCARTTSPTVAPSHPLHYPLGFACFEYFAVKPSQNPAILMIPIKIFGHFNDLGFVTLCYTLLHFKKTLTPHIGVAAPSHFAHFFSSGFSNDPHPQPLSLPTRAESLAFGLRPETINHRINCLC